MTYTEQVCSYLERAREARLPEKTVRTAQAVTLDALGACIAARSYPVAAGVSTLVIDGGSKQSAYEFYKSRRIDGITAALVNGTLAADMELDDVHPRSNLHASSVFFPALLAMGEESSSSGEQWLKGLVAAYDIGCRLSIAMGVKQQFDRGFHPTSLSGVMGATAGGAVVYGLNARKTAAAFGLAASQACGINAWMDEEEHYTKSLQSGVAARNAVTSVQLAASGYKGPSAVFDFPHDMLSSFVPSPERSLLVEELGSRFEIEHTGFKYYSCCVFIHSTLDSVLFLSRKNGFSPSDVELISVSLPQAIAYLVDGNAVTTHNLQYCTAVALYDGQVGREQTAIGRSKDTSVIELSRRVSLRGSTELDNYYPGHWPTTVEVRLRDGRIFREERLNPQGAPGMWQIEDLRAKFKRVTEPELSAGVIERILEAVENLPSLSSIRELTSILEKP